jgi:radical SAM-linked protein
MRIRLRYRKLGKVRFTSHRDIARCWERALRRAELPIAITEGFSPRPKVHFGLALSTGHESLGEYLDVDLREPEAADVDLGALPERLTPLLPPGIDVEAVAVIDRSQASLQEAVTSCTWVIEVPGTSTEALSAAVDTILSAAELPVVRERKGKKVADDLRPGIIALSVVGATPPDVLEPGAVLQAELATHPRSVRPSELLAAFDPPLTEGRVRRTHQWITSDGATREPLSPGAPSPALAGASAP